MYIITDTLPSTYANDVWQLLFDADEEFVPPLSARNNTTQQSLQAGDSSKDGPTDYFAQMQKQSFILALEAGKVIGFLSFIPDHLLETGDHRVTCDYISTIVVSPACRNQGITRKMYEKLFSERKGRKYATRTWSENRAHLHLLEKIGFSLIHCIPSDRGPGIDTVYYMKEDRSHE